MESSIILPHIKNHVSVQTYRTVQPWDYKPGEVPDLAKDKYREWCKDPNTDHCFFSAVVGLNPCIRVNDENPATEILGLVADYDAPIRPTDWETMTTRGSADYKPAYGSMTPSGHGRLVWLFSEPLAVPHAKLFESFLKHAIRETRMDKMFPGFERDAVLDVAKTYDVGREWRKLSDHRIGSSTLQHWLFKSAEKIGYAGPAKTEVPIERVAQELEKQFPNRWRGEFRVGARGVRFWDPTADNHTAAIVCDSGMLTFTSQPFVPWREIFGSKFVDEFQADRIAAATANTYYDGKHYWRQSHEGEWTYQNKEDCTLDLKVRCALSTSSFRGEASEADRAIHYIQNTNRVAKALPYVHQSPGIIRRHGKKCLNISGARVVPPSLESGDWAEHFPFIGEWLAPSFFADPCDTQWDYFMAELRHLYATAQAVEMAKGHALFFAGPTNKGKTLLQTVLVGGLLGGSCDVADYMLKESSFNGSYFNHPVWTIDDSTPGKDPRSRAQFSAMVKKFVANNMFEFTQKFRDSAEIEWCGRLLVSLNLDPESLLMLPDAHTSLLDKVSFFKISERDFKFPQHADRFLRAELPHFARWLLDWEPPEACFGDSRYALGAYHHPELLDASRRGGHTAEFKEMLALFCASHFAQVPNETHWVGTATELTADMNNDDSISALMKQARLSPSRIGMELSKLTSLGFDLKDSTVRGNRVWKIGRLHE